MSYPDLETYRKLYARYIAENGRSVNELINLAGDLKGKHALDLCGGAGEIAVEAVKRGAEKVVMVDSSPDMVDRAALERHPYIFEAANLEDWLPYSCQQLVDVVFCRQAVNYWFDDAAIYSLKWRIKTGGQFIFNTFSRKPSWTPTVKEYELNGLHYAEVSYLRHDDIVHHVQCCEGMEPHQTWFRWIAPETFQAILGVGFDPIEILSDGATTIYNCTRKEED